MKSLIKEWDGCFEIILKPETMEEQAQIIRMGMNATKEIRSFSSDINRNLTVGGYIVLGKKKRTRSSVNHNY
jgi:hypothetical protein